MLIKNGGLALLAFIFIGCAYSYQYLPVSGGDIANFPIESKLTFGVSVTNIKVLKKENKHLRVQIGGSLLGGTHPSFFVVLENLADSEISINLQDFLAEIPESKIKLSLLKCVQANPDISQEVIPCEVRILPKFIERRFIEYSAIPRELRQPTPATENRMPSHKIRLMNTTSQKDLAIDFLFKLAEG